MASASTTRRGTCFSRAARLGGGCRSRRFSGRAGSAGSVTALLRSSPSSGACLLGELGGAGRQVGLALDEVRETGLLVRIARVVEAAGIVPVVAASEGQVVKAAELDEPRRFVSMRVALFHESKLSRAPP